MSENVPDAENTNPTVASDDETSNCSDPATLSNSDHVPSPLSPVSTRQYVDQNVVSILIWALEELVKERPENAWEFLGNFLLSQKDRFKPANQNNS